MSPAELEILGDAIESDWGLMHIRLNSRQHYPEASEQELFEINRDALVKLVEAGFVKLYWLSSRPASQPEAAEVRDRFRLPESRNVEMSIYDEIPSRLIHSCRRCELGSARGRSVRGLHGK